MFSITTQDGVQALAITVGGASQNWPAGIVSTLGPDDQGFTVPPPFYVEVKTLFPAGNNWWDVWNGGVGIGSIGQGPPGKSDAFIEFDSPETFGNNGGGLAVDYGMWGHNASNSPTNPNGQGFYPSSPPGWQGVWHTFGALITPATGNSSNPGGEIVYFDGNEYMTFVAPTDSASVAAWNEPTYWLWGNAAGCCGMVQNHPVGDNGFNPKTSTNGFTAYIAYMRIWAP